MDKLIYTINSLKLVNHDSKPDAEGCVKVEGYACHFNKPNGNYEIVDEKSFKEFFKELKDGRQMPYFNYGHDHLNIIGGWDEIKSDDNGLYVKGHLNANVAFVRDTVLPLIESGDLLGLSTEGYGFDCTVDSEGNYYVGNFMLLGISLVALAADSAARINIMNSLSEAAALRSNKPNNNQTQEQMKKNSINDKIAELKEKLDNAIKAEDQEAAAQVLSALNELVASLSSKDEEVEAQAILNRLKEIEDKVNAMSEKEPEQTKKLTEMNNKINKDFLRSEEALIKFRNCLESSDSTDQFRNNWIEVLRNAYDPGITDESGFLLPEPVKLAIENAWNKEYNFLRELNNTGAKSICIALASETEAGSARAHGHKGRDTKIEQGVTLTPKEVVCQYIYKYIGVGKKTVWENNQAFLEWITSELTERIINELMMAVLVGDGRLADADDKITSVESVVRESTDAYVTIATDDGTTQLKEQLRDLRATIKNKGKAVWAFMPASVINRLAKVTFGSDSTIQYQPLEVLAAELGVDRIVETDLVDGTDNICIMMTMKGYYTVGGINPEYYSWHDGKTNTNYYREEVPFGGAVGMAKSAAVLVGAGA